MNSQRDPEMRFETTAGEPWSRPRWRRAWLVVGVLIGVSGALVVVGHVIGRAQEAAARAN